LGNPAVRQAYDAQAPEFELARELIAARMRAGLKPGVVAARMGTIPTQSFLKQYFLPHHGVRGFSLNEKI
jgi:hypothetical protein